MSTMKLAELKPEFVEGNTHLIFSCPKCPYDESQSRYANCLISIPIKVTEHETHPWGWNGETDFDKVTLTPSIWHHCKSDPHFFIRDGRIEMC